MSKHRVTFLPGGVTVEVDPDNPPKGVDGEPGSVLGAALAGGVPLDHACGGVGVCGTCHVKVEEGAENLSPADDDEMDAVSQAPGNQLNSRLACKAIVRGDVTVTIPNWNRNAVSEGH